MRLFKFFSTLAVGIILSLVLISVSSAGMFGSPEPTTKGVGNEWQVGVGYWYHEDTLKNGGDTKFKENQIYAELAKGFGNYGIYARLGGTNAKSSDIFTSNDPAVTFASNDWDSNWKPFGTLGVKGYYSVNKQLGFGAFIQGSYIFGDLEDSTTMYVSGVPVQATAKIRNVWDAEIGLAIQVTPVEGLKIYAGPYAYYTEGKGEASASYGGLSAAEEVTLKNKTNFGGFLGFDVTIANAWHLNVEGQYSESFSVGAAVAFSF
jgi:hypothetical protein